MRLNRIQIFNILKIVFPEHLFYLPLEEPFQIRVMVHEESWGILDRFERFLLHYGGLDIDVLDSLVKRWRRIL